MGVAACGSSSKHSAGSTATTAAAAASASAMPQAIVDAANKEGQVEVYTVDSTAEVASVQAAWAKAYPGIKLNYDRLSPAEIEARITAELSSGVKADLIDLADDPFVQGLSAGAHLVKPTGPSFSDPKWTGSAPAPAPEAYVEQGGPYCWGWNTKLVPNGIHSFDDYLALKPGLIGIGDPAANPPALVPNFLSMNQAAGYDFVAKLGAAHVKPMIYAGGNPTTAALASGEIGASLDATCGQIAQQKVAGAPVDYALYNGYYLINTDEMIVKGSPHPNAAQVFANWRASQAGMQAMADGQASILFRSDVKTFLDVTGFKSTVYKPIADAQVKDFINQFNQLFK